MNIRLEESSTSKDKLTEASEKVESIKTDLAQKDKDIDDLKLRYMHMLIKIQCSSMSMYLYNYTWLY